MNIKLLISGALSAFVLVACGGGGGNNATPAPPAPPPVADPFVFQTFPKTAYGRFDRMGQPVVATVLLLTADKDPFNGSDPNQDGDYAALMTQRLEQLHVGLDDAIIAEGLAVCPTDVCLRQVIGKIIPDTLQFDLSQPDGFPNGRRFEDPTVDRILSMALLDLTTPGTCGSGPCTVFSFEQLPTNPTRNESPFLAQFPYLAAAHPPP
ncbi:MAG: hypothetical protein V4650_12615 [Pseudomonadota bacterium]